MIEGFNKKSINNKSYDQDFLKNLIKIDLYIGGLKSKNQMYPTQCFHELKIISVIKDQLKSSSQKIKKSTE